MNFVDGLANQAVFFARNTAYNLDFIPDDKLDWKPEPSANSALEIINHTVGAVKGMQPMLSGATSFGKPEFAPATTREGAKKLLIDSAEEYAQALRQLKPEDLQKQVDLPWGKQPMAMVCSMPVVDLIHHHGQIAYLQTMLGDTESHFDFSLL